jgi:hypothetical protein
VRSLLAVCKEDPLSAVLLVCWAVSLGFAVGGICAARPIAARLWPVQGAAAPGGEVIRMQRTALAVLALCAGCAADRTAPASLLPPGHRPPVAVPMDDGGALVDVVPAIVDSAPEAAPDVTPPSPDLAGVDIVATVDGRAAGCSMSGLPAGCAPGWEPAGSVRCGTVTIDAYQGLSWRCYATGAAPVTTVGPSLVCSRNAAVFYAATCADCLACGAGRLTP